MYHVIITTNTGSETYGKYASQERAETIAAGLRQVYTDATIRVAYENQFRG